MNILRQVDIENEVRMALADYFEAYCPPLPENYGLPCVFVEQTGGGESNQIDTFQVRLSCRAETDAEASETLRNALGVLQVQAEAQYGAIRHVTLNSLASWGNDPVRPDLKLCTALVLVVAHPESFEINH